MISGIYYLFPGLLAEKSEKHEFIEQNSINKNFDLTKCEDIVNKGKVYCCQLCSNNLYYGIKISNLGTFQHKGMWKKDTPLPCP